MNVITLWFKGNHRLKRDADETFADGHSATDRLYYEVLHTQGSSDDDHEKEASNARLFIFVEVHASFMMYT